MIDKAYIKDSFSKVFKALNTAIWTKKVICSCQDDYGLIDPECPYCNGSGYIQDSTVIEADVQELKGDERIVVDAGILNTGDIIVRTIADNDIKIDDFITYQDKTYQVKYVILDQLGVFIQVGAHRVVSSLIVKDEAIKLLSYSYGGHESA